VGDGCAPHRTPGPAHEPITRPSCPHPAESRRSLSPQHLATSIKGSLPHSINCSQNDYLRTLWYIHARLSNDINGTVATLRAPICARGQCEASKLGPDQRIRQSSPGGPVHTPTTTGRGYLPCTGAAVPPQHIPPKPKTQIWDQLFQPAHSPKQFRESRSTYKYPPQQICQSGRNGTRFIRYGTRI
jgi:hypothetical protein